MAAAIAPIQELVFKIGFLCGGIGGVALGFKRAQGEYMGVPWRWEIIASVDNDPNRNKVFTRLTKAPAHTLDLFDRRAYLAYHGTFDNLPTQKLAPVLDRLMVKAADSDGLVEYEGVRYWKYETAWVVVLKWSPPPVVWNGTGRELGQAEMQHIFGPKAPDAFFTTSDCKGNSRLLPEQAAQMLKYRALNSLVPRCMYLCMLSWPGQPVPVILNENVPGIVQRSSELLADLKKTAHGLGYETHHSTHDAGEIAVGGLAQKRLRAFWIQRHAATVPQFIYKPTRYPLRAIRDVLDPLPMPGDPKGGPLHARLNIDFLTSLRIAATVPGGDWRDHPGAGEWRLMTFDGREVPPEAFSKFVLDRDGNPALDKNKRPKVKWFHPDPKEWGRIFVLELLPGAKHYPSIKLHHQPMGNGKGAYWVMKASATSGTMTADPGHRKSGGASVYADERIKRSLKGPSKPGRHTSHLRVAAPGGEVGTATGADHLANGAPTVADERLQLQLEFRENRHTTKYGVEDPNTSARTTTTSDRLGSGAPSRGDIRIHFEPRDNAMGNMDPNAPAPTLGGNTAVTSSNSAAALSDGRLSLQDGRGRPGGESFGNSYEVTPPDQPGGTLTTGGAPSNGGKVAADERLSLHLTRDPKGGTASVLDANGESTTITPHCDVNGDAKSVSDMRFTCKAHGGTCGVQDDTDASTAMIASFDIYAAAAARTDARVSLETGATNVVCTLEWTGPGPKTIASLTDEGKVDYHYWPDWFPPFLMLNSWNQWPHPLTDLEMAVLQGFDAFDEDGVPFHLEGSRKDRRAAIGNAVPPASSQGIANGVSPTMVVARMWPDAWMLSPTGEGVWVDRPDSIPDDIWAWLQEDLARMAGEIPGSEPEGSPLLAGN